MVVGEHLDFYLQHKGEKLLMRKQITPRDALGTAGLNEGLRAGLHTMARP